MDIQRILSKNTKAIGNYRQQQVSISSTFYVRLFCTNVFSLLRFWLWTNFCTKNALVKCWWNWQQKTEWKCSRHVIKRAIVTNFETRWILTLGSNYRKSEISQHFFNQKFLYDHLKTSAELRALSLFKDDLELQSILPYPSKNSKFPPNEKVRNS